MPNGMDNIFRPKDIYPEQWLGHKVISRSLDQGQINLIPEMNFLLLCLIYQEIHILKVKYEGQRS